MTANDAKYTKTEPGLATKEFKRPADGKDVNGEILIAIWRGLYALRHKSIGIY
jgi:hypothetical protein